MARKPSLTSPARPTQTSTPSPITPRLVTIKQAAAYCSCAVWAIRQAIWSKELRAWCGIRCQTERWTTGADKFNVYIEVVLFVAIPGKSDLIALR